MQLLLVRPPRSRWADPTDFKGLSMQKSACAACFFWVQKQEGFYMMLMFNPSLPAASAGPSHPPSWRLALAGLTPQTSRG